MGTCVSSQIQQDAPHLLCPLLLHVCVLEEAIDGVIGQDFVVENIYCCLNGGFAT